MYRNTHVDHSAVKERSWLVHLLGTRLSVRVVQPERPTGLAAIVWSQHGEDINIKVADRKFTRCGSIIWTSSTIQNETVARYGWSLGSEEGFWNFCNTLGYKGKRWVFVTPDAAFRSLCEYVRLSIQSGPRDWK